MLIIDWMKTKLITVPPETNLYKCRRLFKEKHISRLPVVDASGNFVGLLSDTDIKDFSPAKATAMEIIEINELLRETTVARVMDKSPVTINYKGTVEQAAMRMVEGRVSCLPVVNDEGRLVGILTDWDIFMAFVATTGSSLTEGAEMEFRLSRERGKLREILDRLGEIKVQISTVLTNSNDDGSRTVKVQFYSEDKSLEEQALEALKDHPGLRYWAHDGKLSIRKLPDFKL